VEANFGDRKNPIVRIKCSVVLAKKKWRAKELEVKRVAYVHGGDRPRKLEKRAIILY